MNVNVLYYKTRPHWWTLLFVCVFPPSLDTRVDKRTSMNAWLHKCVCKRNPEHVHVFVCGFSSLSKQTGRSLQQGEKCAAWKYLSCSDMSHHFLLCANYLTPAHSSTKKPDSSNVHAPKWLNKTTWRIQNAWNIISFNLLVVISNDKSFT